MVTTKTETVIENSDGVHFVEFQIAGNVAMIAFFQESRKVTLREGTIELSADDLDAISGWLGSLALELRQMSATL